MTSPRRAESTSLGRYYQAPDASQANTPLISVTNVLSVGCAKPALVPWAAKIAAQYAMNNLPTLVARSRTEDPEELRKEVSRQVTVARDKAADLGSRIHALAEAHVTGAALAEEEGDDEARHYVTQYQRFLDDFNIDIDRDVEASEMTVANPGHGYAGTGDLWVRLPFDGYVDGKLAPVTDPAKRGLFLVDIKTSATRPATSVYGEYALQLTALRRCVEAWLPNDTVIAAPPVVGCAVLNLRRRTYELVPLPSGKAEWDAYLGCLALAKWMHGPGNAVNKGEHRPVTPAGRAKPKRGTKTTPTATPKAA